MLTGEAKKLYMRGYMRRYRSNKRAQMARAITKNVKERAIDSVRAVRAGNYVVLDEFADESFNPKAIVDIVANVAIQHDNPMKVGCKTCGGTGQVGEELHYLGRSVGFKACPDCNEDADGSIDIETLAMLDEACGNKLCHGFSRDANGNEIPEY